MCNRALNQLIPATHPYLQCSNCGAVEKITSLKHLDWDYTTCGWDGFSGLPPEGMFLLCPACYSRDAYLMDWSFVTDESCYFQDTKKNWHVNVTVHSEEGPHACDI